MVIVSFCWAIMAYKSFHRHSLLLDRGGNCILRSNDAYCQELDFKKKHMFFECKGRVCSPVSPVTRALRTLKVLSKIFTQWINIWHQTQKIREVSENSIYPSASLLYPRYFTVVDNYMITLTVPPWELRNFSASSLLLCKTRSTPAPLRCGEHYIRWLVRRCPGVPNTRELLNVCFLLRLHITEKSWKDFFLKRRYKRKTDDSM